MRAMFFFLLVAVAPACSQGPSNNSCTTPIAIGNGLTNGTNVGATLSPVVPTSCGTWGADVWYSYVASCTGTATIGFCPPGSSTIDTVLAAYSGTCGALVLLACNDDSCGLASQVTVPVTAGQTYIIRVGGYAGATGSFVLNISCTSQPQPPTGSGWNQYRTDTGAAIPSGGAVPYGVGVYFSATVNDPNPGNTVSLEIELRQLPATFTGVPTVASPFVAIGSVATAPSVPGLAPGNYGWACRVKDNTGLTSSWLPALTPDFVVSCPPPTAPVLSWPCGVPLLTGSPTLSWNASTGTAPIYTVQVASDAGFANLLVNQSGISATSYGPLALPCQTGIYWRVRAANSCGTSAFSTCSFINGSQPPPAPILGSPCNISLLTNSPVFTWSGSSGIYDLDIASDAGFSAVVFHQTTSSTSIGPVALPGQCGAPLWWRVRETQFGCGTSGYSSCSFTNGSPIPSVPSPIAPCSMSVSNPVLSWTPSSGIGSIVHRVQVGTDAAFNTLVVNQTTAGLSLAPSLATYMNYWWRVRGEGSCNNSAWSSSCSLQVGALPPGVSLFGQGTSGTNGVTPQISVSSTSPPSASNPSFAITLSSAKPWSIAFLAIVPEIPQGSVPAPSQMVAADGRALYINAGPGSSALYFDHSPCWEVYGAYCGVSQPPAFYPGLFKMIAGEPAGVDGQGQASIYLASLPSMPTGVPIHFQWYVYDLSAPCLPLGDGYGVVDSIVSRSKLALCALGGIAAVSGFEPLAPLVAFCPASVGAAVLDYVVGTFLQSALNNIVCFSGTQGMTVVFSQ